MHKKSFFYSLFLTGFLMLLSLPVEAWDCCGPLGVTAEVRVAYYHPNSSRVRRIYGSGWADYQFEVSKSFTGFGGLFGCGNSCCGNWGSSGCCDTCGDGGFFSNLETRVFVGVSGFSRKGESIGFHDHTRLQLIPINFGARLYYPIFCNTKIFIGGAACYSFLRIRDHSDYVKRHVDKEEWGALFQSGITYTACDWLVVTAFFDYFFQRFNFHDEHYSSFYGSSYFYDDRYIERNDLNLSGYKVGVGLGLTF
jgi:outer membrane protein